MFQLADRFDSKQGLQVAGHADLRLPLVRRAAHRAFDSGLVNPDGSAAPRVHAVQEVRIKGRPASTVRTAGGTASVPPACRGSTSTPTRRPGPRRRCGRPWPRPRSATSSTSRTRRSPSSASGWRSCSASRPPSSCPRARCATRSASGCTSGRAATRPILHRISHPIIAEAGGPAAFSGAMMHPLDRPSAACSPATTLAARCAPGRPLLPALAARLGRAVDEHGRRPRVAAGAAARGRRGRQGERAATAHGRRAADERRRRLAACPTTEWTRGFDTAWIDFSKGLGAPMGAVPGRLARS